MGLLGLEPRTSPLSGVRSSQLSYKPSRYNICWYNGQQPRCRGRSVSLFIPQSRVRCVSEFVLRAVTLLRWDFPGTDLEAIEIQKA